MDNPRPSPFFLLAIPAFYGHYQLMSYAQSIIGAYLLIPVMWAVLYFPLVDKLGPKLFHDWDPALPRQAYVSHVSGLCLLVAFCLVQAMIWLSLGPPTETLSPLEAKLLYSRSASPYSWRLRLQDDSYFYVPYPAALSLKKGDAIRFTHRDAWFGVRFILSYQIKDHPVVPYDQMRDAPSR